MKKQASKSVILTKPENVKKKGLLYCECVYLQLQSAQTSHPGLSCVPQYKDIISNRSVMSQHLTS
jgi:hypothetical protein